MSSAAKPSDWGDLSSDMDALLDLDVAHRSARLTEIATHDVAQADRLRAWLDAIERSEGLWQPTSMPLAMERVGPWRLLHLIGRGGMGDVYLAERADGAFEKRVALKLLREDRPDNTSIERERALLAKLRHPGIAQLLDGGVLDHGRPWLVTEWVDGQRLDEWLQKNQPVLLARVHMLQAIAEAVAYAHTHLIVHRDLKPTNIIVAENSAPRLLDFGIARLLDSNKLQSDTVDRAMTPAFAAPEQLLGQPITTRTDVHALGSLLYWLLTESPPHDPGNLAMAAWVERVCQQMPEAPSRRTRLVGIDANLDAIVAKAIAIDPAARYASADGLSNDLAAWLHGDQVSARPATRFEHWRRFARRNALPVTLAGALFVALLAGLIMTLLQAQKTQRALTLAKSEQATALSELERNQALRNGMMAAFRVAGENESGPANYWLDRIAQQAEVKHMGVASMRAQLLAQLADLEIERSQPARARALFERLLADPDARISAETQARARCSLALALSNLGEGAAAAREHALGLQQAETLQGAARLILVQCLQLTPGPDGEIPSAAALPALERAEHELDALGTSPSERQTRASLLHQLGSAFDKGGRYNEAIVHYRQALALDRELGQAETLNSATTLSAVAGLEMIRGDLRAADQDYSTALALSERVGGHSLSLAVDLANHAGLKGNLGDDAQAEQLARRALKILDAMSDLRSETRANAELELGKALERQGKYDAALAAINRSEQAFFAALGRDHDYAHFPSIARAKTFSRMGRNDAARALIEPNLAHFRAVDSKGAIVSCLLVLASIERDTDHFDAAHAVISEALHIQRDRSSGPEHWRVAVIETELADIEAIRGDQAAARTLAQHAHPILLRVLGAEHPRTQRAAELLRL